MTDIKQALILAKKQLTPYSESAQIDAEVLLSYTLSKSRSWLYTHPEANIPSHQLAEFQKMVAKRALGTPVAYITGLREFWSLPLAVNKETLIPRPETELLVECALVKLPHSHLRLLDLGTGSGAIILALAKEREAWELYASDLSEKAIQTAKNNAQFLGLKNILFFHSSWFDALNATWSFDAIVSNPPYIAANDPHLQIGDVRFEPTLALVGGEDGLHAIREIIDGSFSRLNPGGFLFIEHGFQQHLTIITYLKQKGYVEIACHNDLNGIPRVISARKHSGENTA